MRGGIKWWRGRGGGSREGWREEGDGRQGGRGTGNGWYSGRGGTACLPYGI